MTPDQIAAAILDAHPELVDRWASSSRKQGHGSSAAGVVKRG